MATYKENLERAIKELSLFDCVRRGKKMVNTGDQLFDALLANAEMERMSSKTVICYDFDKAALCLQKESGVVFIKFDQQKKLFHVSYKGALTIGEDVKKSIFTMAIAEQFEPRLIVFSMEAWLRVMVLRPTDISFEDWLLPELKKIETKETPHAGRIRVCKNVWEAIIATENTLQSVGIWLLERGDYYAEQRRDPALSGFGILRAWTSDSIQGLIYQCQRDMGEIKALFLEKAAHEKAQMELAAQPFPLNLRNYENWLFSRANRYIDRWVPLTEKEPDWRKEDFFVYTIENEVLLYSDEILSELISHWSPNPGGREKLPPNPVPIWKSFKEAGPSWRNYSRIIAIFESRDGKPAGWQILDPGKSFFSPHSGALVEYFCPIFYHMEETLPSPGEGRIFIQSQDGEITEKRSLTSDHH